MEPTTPCQARDAPLCPAVPRSENLPGLTVSSGRSNLPVLGLVGVGTSPAEASCQ